MFLKVFWNLQEKHLCQSLFFNKVAHFFSCKFCKVFKKTFFIEHLRAIASQLIQKAAFKHWIFEVNLRKKGGTCYVLGEWKDHNTLSLRQTTVCQNILNKCTIAKRPECSKRIIIQLINLEFGVFKFVQGLL